MADDRRQVEHEPVIEASEHRPDYFMLGCSCGAEWFASGSVEVIAREFAHHIVAEMAKLVLGEDVFDG